MIDAVLGDDPAQLWALRGKKPASNCACIVRMTTVSFADACANLSRIIESAVTTHERCEVTWNDERVDVLLNADGFDSLIETVDVLCRDSEIAAIRRGITEFESDDVSTADEQGNTRPVRAGAS